ncbi:GNAT family N-acetyltransferase [Collimonas sp.]|jgi:ribosomal-protein-alanine N-acetyltransferase|uniref:GNAT family N-acetyltransferase n=1 Tax=Collimonas sp. TaxID=1963772 RepID=UPI0037C06A76
MTNPTEFPSLQTDRLLLREIVASDADELLAIHGDAELMRWFGSDPLTDIAAAHGLIKAFAGWRQQENPGVRWGLQIKEQPQLLGTCGLFRWDRNWRKCVLGYELAEHAQKRGLMLEALTASLSWGFKHMDLNRVEAQFHPDNHASLKLVKRLGFVEEGRLRQAGYWRNQYHDLLQVSLLRSEWSRR